MRRALFEKSREGAGDYPNSMGDHPGSASQPRVAGAERLISRSTRSAEDATSPCSTIPRPVPPAEFHAAANRPLADSQQALKLWDETGIAAVAGWHAVKRLAIELGVTQVIESPRIKEASVSRSRSGYSIGVDRAQLISRKRFSFAHEVAHLLLDPNLVRAGRPAITSGGVSEKAVERHCEQIAAEILMPRETFKRVASRFPMALWTIPRIAAMFGTSIEATALRLAEVSSRSFVIAKVENSERLGKLAIRWARLSSGAPTELGRLPFRMGQAISESAFVERALATTRPRMGSLTRVPGFEGSLQAEAHGFGNVRRFALILVQLEQCPKSLQSRSELTLRSL